MSSAFIFAIINFMKSLKSIFRIGKRKRIRALRLEQEKEKNTQPRFNNPYFPNKNKPEPNKEPRSFKSWIFKKDGWAYLGILLLIFGSIGYLTFGTSYFIITNISVSGNENITTNEVTTIINNHLNQNRLFILPRKNYIFFNTNKATQVLEQEINNKFALESLSINKKWSNTIEIQLKERIPGLIWASNEEYHFIDLEGVVSQKIDNIEEQKQNFPIIYDKNNAPLEENKQVITKELINFIFEIEDKIPQISKLEIESYNIPEITCQEQQYRAEKIIKQEIEETEDEEVKDQKREILEQYNQGEISIDESLSMLEDVKKQEKSSSNSNTNSEDEELIKWEAVYIPKDCDYIKVNNEINITTKQGYEIYFDNNIDLDGQLNNLNMVLNQKIDNPENLQYIDLRFSDRVYYK